jgi:ligand-binding SRPBCC domain-containing protein
MAKIVLLTQIHAPIEQVFDLCRDIDFHQISTGATQEKAIAGRTSGLIEENESVTWQARHFGIVQRLTVVISKMRRPVYFRDVMTQGAFSKMAHTHHFFHDDGATLMVDQFEFESPFGILGRWVSSIVLTPYLTRFLESRNHILKQKLEGRLTV